MGKKSPNLKRLQKDVKKMKKLFKKPEVKQSMIVQNPALGVSTAGNLFQIGTIAPGVAHDQRIGNEVELLTTNIRYMWALGDTGYNNGRLAIIKTRGALATLSDAFETTSYGTFGGVYASWDYDKVEKVFYDHNTTMNQLVSGARRQVFTKEYVKTPMELKFDSNQPNSQLDFIYIVAVSDSLLAPHPTLNLVARTRYTDV